MRPHKLFSTSYLVVTILWKTSIAVSGKSDSTFFKQDEESLLRGKREAEDPVYLLDFASDESLETSPLDGDRARRNPNSKFRRTSSMDDLADDMGDLAEQLDKEIHEAEAEGTVANASPGETVTAVRDKHGPVQIDKSNVKYGRKYSHNKDPFITSSTHPNEKKSHQKIASERTITEETKKTQQKSITEHTSSLPKGLLNSNETKEVPKTLELRITHKDIKGNVSGTETTTVKHKLPKEMNNMHKDIESFRQNSKHMTEEMTEEKKKMHKMFQDEGRSFAKQRDPPSAAHNKTTGHHANPVISWQNSNQDRSLYAMEIETLAKIRLKQLLSGKAGTSFLDTLKDRPAWFQVFETAFAIVSKLMPPTSFPVGILDETIKATAYITRISFHQIQMDPTKISKVEDALNKCKANLKIPKYTYNEIENTCPAQLASITTENGKVNVRGMIENVFGSIGFDPRSHLILELAYSSMELCYYACYKELSISNSVTGYRELVTLLFRHREVYRKWKLKGSKSRIPVSVYLSVLPSWNGRPFEQLTRELDSVKYAMKMGIDGNKNLEEGTIPPHLLMRNNKFPSTNSKQSTKGIDLMRCPCGVDTVFGQCKKCGIRNKNEFGRNVAQLFFRSKI